MRKKTKLTLEDLKVRSFVTSLNKEDKKEARAGFFPSFGPTECGGPRICGDTFVFRCKGYYHQKIDLEEPVESNNPEPQYFGVFTKIGSVIRICPD